MGNLTSFEVNLDDFDINNPTPLDGQQQSSLSRCKDSGRLDFSLQNLTDIPVQIYELANIVSLNLSINKLKFLSQPLFELALLTNLDISANELEFLPDEISQLALLQSLNVRHNRLTSLPESVGKLTRLQKINLEYNRIKHMPNLENLKELTEIRLKYNRVTRMPSTPGVIRDCLDLQSNCVQEFPDYPQLETLKEIQLIDNSVTKITKCEHLKSLQKLIASTNKIDDISGLTSSLAAITELDLRENRIMDIPAQLGQIVTLKKLTLANNRIKAVPAELFHLTGLNMLNLGGNEISSFPPGLSNLANLKELILTYNKFKSWPDEITQLGGLQILNLSWNLLTEIPEEGIAGLLRLSYLLLNGNMLKELPSNLGVLKCIKEIYLAANELTDLPDSMGQMKGLELIDVRYNKLTTLPLALKSLTFLENVDLGDNDPNLEIPQDFEKKKTMNINMTPSRAHGSTRFEVCHADMKGKRMTMEDAVVANVLFRTTSDEGFFAVYDGHGGEKAAQYAAKRHPEILEEQLKGCEGLDEDDVIDAIRTSFVDCSKEMTPSNIKRSGTTAVTTVVLGNKLYVADVGDSRAVMWRDGKALRISLDHKPDLPSEEKRIRNLNGFVSPNGRVVGMLAVSRALGDVDLQPFVSAEPFVDVFDIAQPPDFLVMACDGVWDVLSDESACAIISGESDIVRAAMKVRDCAYSYGSQDNISVVLVKFKV